MRKAEKKEYLTPEDLKRDYPMMLALFGPELIEIERLDGPGMSSAHMIFAPRIERALRGITKEKLEAAIGVSVSIKRLRFKKRAARSEREKKEG